MIEVEQVTYDYPNKRALDGVSFVAPAKSVVALVGPNGAGKTTLLRCLAALDAPFSGTVRIDGVDAVADPRAVHGRVGYLSDFFGLYDDLTVRQSLVFAARARAVGPAEALARAEAAAARVGLASRFNDRAGALSRGMRQRLGIAQTIVHGPKVLLLDEPAAGLDPEARRALSTLILELRDEGMTIIVSSHILAELEDYCDRMIALEGGRILGGGPIEVSETARARVLVELAEPWPGLEAALAAAGAESESVSELQAIADVRGGAAGEAALLRALIAAGAPVRAFAPRKRTLEDAYFEDALGRPPAGRGPGGAA